MQADSEKHANMPHLEWIAKAPTTPGKYVWGDRDRIRIYEVVPHPTLESEFATKGEMTNSLPLSKWTGWWAGPIR